MREKAVASIPPDESIATFRTVKRLREKNGVDERNQDEHYANERAFEYICGVYFDSNHSLATEALNAQNAEMARHFTREIFRTRYPLEKLNNTTHKEVISRIAYSDFYNLSRLVQHSLNCNISIADDVANGIREERDFIAKIDPKLAEGYIDLLGQLLIDTMERNVPSSDPNSTFFWAGIALRIHISIPPPQLAVKLLTYFEKVLFIIKERQAKSYSPMLEKIKETICREVASVRKYNEADKTISDKAEAILAQYPDVDLKE